MMGVVMFWNDCVVAFYFDRAQHYQRLHRFGVVGYRLFESVVQLL